MWKSGVTSLSSCCFWCCVLDPKPGQRQDDFYHRVCAVCRGAPVQLTEKLHWLCSVDNGVEGPELWQSLIPDSVQAPWSTTANEHSAVLITQGGTLHWQLIKGPLLQARVKSFAPHRHLFPHKPHWKHSTVSFKANTQSGLNELQHVMLHRWPHYRLHCVSGWAYRQCISPRLVFIIQPIKQIESLGCCWWDWIKTLRIYYFSLLCIVSLIPLYPVSYWKVLTVLEMGHFLLQPLGFVSVCSCRNGIMRIIM